MGARRFCLRRSRPSRTRTAATTRAAGSPRSSARNGPSTIAPRRRKRTAKEIAAASPDGRGYDGVFNTPGAASIDRSVAIAAFEGVILDILGDFPTRPGFQMKRLSFVRVFAGRAILLDVGQSRIGKILRAAAELVDQGRLRPLIAPQRFTCAQVRDAHRHAAHNRPIGKVVLSRH